VISRGHLKLLFNVKVQSFETFLPLIGCYQLMKDGSHNDTNALQKNMTNTSDGHPTNKKAENNTTKNA